MSWPILDVAIWQKHSSKNLEICQEIPELEVFEI